jgi:hypothetical protein
MDGMMDALNRILDEIQRPTLWSVTVEEGERQMLLLALAELAKARPGWEDALGDLSKKFSGFEMFEQFRTMEARHKLAAVEACFEKRDRILDGRNK